MYSDQVGKYLQPSDQKVEFFSTNPGYLQSPRCARHLHLTKSNRNGKLTDLVFWVFLTNSNRFHRVFESLRTRTFFHHSNPTGFVHSYGK